MPPDTLWSENPTYLQGSSVYNPSALYNEAVPYNVAPATNLNSVESRNPTLWTGEVNE